MNNSAVILYTKESFNLKSEIINYKNIISVGTRFSNYLYIFIVTKLFTKI